MVADAASRQVGYKEEFVPQTTYNALINFFGFFPTVDGFATRANKKCEKFCSRFYIFEQPDFVDFLGLSDTTLTSQWWYLFPPRAIRGQVARTIDRLKLQTIFVFHIWDEIPPEIHVIFKSPNRILKLGKEMRITLIPAEREITLDNKKLQGFFNHNINQTFVILTNPKGPISENIASEMFSFL